MNFELQTTSDLARAGKIFTDHGEIETPMFMPVGTPISCITSTYFPSAENLLRTNSETFISPDSKPFSIQKGVKTTVTIRNKTKHDISNFTIMVNGFESGDMKVSEERHRKRCTDKHHDEDSKREQKNLLDTKSFVGASNRFLKQRHRGPLDGRASPTKQEMDEERKRCARKTNEQESSVKEVHDNRLPRKDARRSRSAASAGPTESCVSSVNRSAPNARAVLES